MSRAKTLLETDTDTVGESFSIDDTIGLGFLPMQISLAAGVTASITVQGKLAEDLPWVDIGEAFTVSGLFEITRVQYMRSITTGVSGGSTSPKVTVTVLERFK